MKKGEKHIDRRRYQQQQRESNTHFNIKKKKNVWFMVKFFTLKGNSKRKRTNSPFIKPNSPSLLERTKTLILAGIVVVYERNRGRRKEG